MVLRGTPKRQPLTRKMAFSSFSNLTSVGGLQQKRQHSQNLGLVVDNSLGLKHTTLEDIWRLQGKNAPGTEPTSTSPSLAATHSPSVHLAYHLTIIYLRAGSWQNGFFADSYFWAAGFFSRTFSPDFFLLIFVGKSAQKNPPGKSPAKSSRI